MKVKTAKCWALMLALAGVAGCQSAAHAGFIIDSFNVGDAMFLISLNQASPPGSGPTRTGTATQAGLNAADVVGGVRETTHTITIPGDGQIHINTGTFGMNNGLNANGIATLRYDGNAAGLGNLNLNLTGDDALVIVVTNADFAADPFTLTARLNDGTNTVQVSQAVAVPVTTPTDVVFLYSLFAGVDLTSINSIEVDVDPDFNGDVIIDSIASRAVLQAETPEPGTLMLIGAALAGLGWSRRRRQ